MSYLDNKKRKDFIKYFKVRPLELPLFNIIKKLLTDKLEKRKRLFMQMFKELTATTLSYL